MTVEEIKESVSMKDVLAKYGVKTDRNGMCNCPIHGERHPSMKVYSDGYKCFACNSAGDIFTFVQEMEGCDFKRAFMILGGSYQYRPVRQRTVAKMSFERKRKERQRAEEKEKLFHKYLIGAIGLCEWWIDNREPLSDDWCYAQTWLPWLWSVFDAKYLEGEEVEEANVFRRCCEIRQKFLTFD